MHGHTDTLTPVFPTARTPDWVKHGANRKAAPVPKTHGTVWPGHRLSSPRSNRGCRQQAGALLCRVPAAVGTRSRRGRPRHRGFRGSGVFVLPQKKAGANKKDVKKMSFHRSSPLHAPSRRSRAKPAGRRASRRAQAEGLTRTFVTSGSCHLTDPTNY